MDDSRFYIPRAEQQALLAHLRAIPHLCLELAWARMKLTRLGDAPASRRQPESRPPHREEAWLAGEELHNTLGTWVRLVCEQRGLDYRTALTLPGDFIGPLQSGWRRATPESATTPQLARWLDRNIISLALTEGAREALNDITRAVQRVKWIINPPEPEITIDTAKLARARAMRLSAGEIATIAKELGEQYRNLTRRRVNHLHETKRINPVPGPWHPDIPMLYQVGDVMDAHLKTPIRQRHSKAG